ncbi:MAG TPA: DNRLRE domain-containing protein [Candidatus Polarisedimenticolia bacterium]|nr:DNRLRE domain-containing protein [Candidatus Polarisedimenticolia bacterium]
MLANRRLAAPRSALNLMTTFLLAAALPQWARAEFATLEPVQDATLIESPTGDLANGSGPAIFAGRIASSSQSVRRAVIAFDIAGRVPEGATITSAQLRLSLTATSAGAVAVEMHRVLTAWGEGASSASGGGGAAALTGDTTWRYRFYDDRLWSHPGGDFDAAVAAAALVDQPGAYFWGSTPALIADVQEWLDVPDRNFGWILLGDESHSQTVKRFESRESADAALRPRLEITYRPLCEPAPVGAGWWRRVCEPDVAGRPGDDGGTIDAACGARLVEEFRLPPFDLCAAVRPEAPPTCEERARRALAVLILNVCSGRLQTTCDASREDAACLTTTIGDRLFEVAALLRAGDCRRAASCAALPQ